MRYRSGWNDLGLAPIDSILEYPVAGINCKRDVGGAAFDWGYRMIKKGSPRCNPSKSGNRLSNDQTIPFPQIVCFCSDQLTMLLPAKDRIRTPVMREDIPGPGFFVSAGVIAKELIQFLGASIAVQLMIQRPFPGMIVGCMIEEVDQLCGKVMMGKEAPGMFIDEHPGADSRIFEQSNGGIGEE